LLFLCNYLNFFLLAKLQLLILVALLLIVPRFFLSKLNRNAQMIIKVVAGVLLLVIAWEFGLEKGFNIYLLIGITIIILFSFGRLMFKTLKQKEGISDSTWTHEDSIKKE